MLSTSQIFLSKAALQNNIDFVKSRLADGVTLSTVVKGNAYGHGIEEFVAMAEDCGIRHFSVFSADEAFRVRNIIRHESDIMIMGEMDKESIEWAVVSGIHFFVFELHRVHQAIEAAKKHNTQAKIHIEVETGMNRTGFDTQSLIALADMIRNNSSFVSLEGVCTHFAGAESVANYVRVMKQLRTFNKLNKWLINNGVQPKIRHTACSAAAMAYPKTQMDMVRVGILNYGFWPSIEIFIDYLGKVSNQKDKVDPLKRVISWKSKVMSVKEVKTGEFVGYGTSYLAQQNIVVASVPVGYSHGYSRVLSNQGRVLVNGMRVGVVGIVNMNMMMIDVTEIPKVEVGDEVTLIGNENGLDITVSSFSELSNQLNYELLTRLPMNIPRHITK